MRWRIIRLHVHMCDNEWQYGKRDESTYNYVTSLCKYTYIRCARDQMQILKQHYNAANFTKNAQESQFQFPNAPDGREALHNPRWHNYASSNM